MNVDPTSPRAASPRSGTQPSPRPTAAPPAPAPVATLSPPAVQNSQADAIAALQRDYSKQQTSLVTLHEMHSKRVADMERAITVLRQKEDEANAKAAAAAASAREYESKHVVGTAAHRAELAEVLKGKASMETECDGKVSALQQGLNEIYVMHAKEVETLTAALAATRVQLLKERQNSWNMPKLISDAVNDTAASCAEHIRALEQQIAATGGEARGLEEEVARLRSQVTSLSAREAATASAGRAALTACQTKAAEWQAKFEASAMQARAVEARISLVEEHSRAEVADQIAQLTKQLAAAQASRSASDAMLSRKSQELSASETALAQDRESVQEGLKRTKADAWQAKVHLAAMTAQYNDAVRALQGEIAGTAEATATAIHQRDTAIAALREEVAQLIAAATGVATERQQAQAREIAALRQQLAEVRPREPSTRATPAKRSQSTAEGPSAEEENAQLKATVQNLQTQIALQRQQADALIAENRFQTSTQVEALRRDAHASATQAQTQLISYRNESAAATSKATAMEQRVEELEGEIKSAKGDLNRVQAKLVLLEARQAVPSPVAKAVEETTHTGERGEHESPARKKPASRRGK